jgi:hypothetical protein
VGMDGVGSEDEEEEEVRWVLPPVPLAGIIEQSRAMQMRGERRESWRQCGGGDVGWREICSGRVLILGGGGGGPREGGRGKGLDVPCFCLRPHHMTGT